MANQVIEHKNSIAVFCIIAAVAVFLSAGAANETTHALGHILTSSELGSAALVAALPLLLAGLGGLLCEVSGTLNLALEAMLLCGALAAYLGSLNGRSPCVGLAAAMLSGCLIGLLHGFFSIDLRGNQIVSAVALNLFAFAVTSYIFRVTYGKAIVLPFSTSFPQRNVPLLRDLPYLGTVVFRQNLLMYAGLALVPVIWLVLYRTNWGLTLRSVGEHPLAAQAVGINVRWVRYVALLAGGSLAGAGGAALVSASGINTFQEGMTAGRGFIAFAAVLFGRWRPTGVLLGALLFGLGDALQIRLQAYSVPVPHQLLYLFPYLITLGALVFFVGEARGPAASGIPFEASSSEAKSQSNVYRASTQAVDKADHPILELRAISKRFGQLRANDGVNLTLRRGEIHAVLGENGAGKSTLMSIIYGLHQPDSGEILSDGRPIEISSPRAAISLGIGMVHQHSMLIPAFSALENIALGTKPGGIAFLNLQQTASEVQKLWSEIDPGAAPSEKVANMMVGQRQKVEIIRALSRQVRILVLDEPTALLTPEETELFLALLKHLRDAGTTVIFVSHKLKEVLAISDRITIMRTGRVIRTLDAAQTSETELAELMVGHTVALEVVKAAASPGDVLVEIKDVCAKSSTRSRELKKFCIELRAGEIHGLAGVEGNGQSELIEVLLGLRPIEGGQVFFRGQDISAMATENRLRCGFAVVPEDRHKQGLILEMSIAENLMLDTFRWESYSNLGWMRPASIQARAKELMGIFKVWNQGIATQVRHLSGGNQQKIVLARAVGRRPAVLLVAQPTRGLDVGAAAEVYERIIEARNGGTAVLLISSELEEILSLSDRVSIIYEGHKVETKATSEVTATYLGLLMTGGNPAHA